MRSGYLNSCRIHVKSFANNDISDTDGLSSRRTAAAPVDLGTRAGVAVRRRARSARVLATGRRVRPFARVDHSYPDRPGPPHGAELYPAAVARPRHRPEDGALCLGAADPCCADERQEEEPQLHDRSWRCLVRDFDSGYDRIYSEDGM